MSTSAPPLMKAWQYTTAKGGLENNLKLATRNVPRVRPQHHLIQVLATALNPVDYKPAEVPILSSLVITKPATPGIDIVGRIVTPAPGSVFKPGQLVFGVASKSPFAGGGLAEFISAPENGIVALPADVAPIDGACIGVAGLTAYQSIVPFVKKGDSVFLNGGSGGTGVFGIQIAKAFGCHVTTTCSTQNVQLCQSLGADEVIDYKTSDVVERLAKSGRKFDHVVDNVGADEDIYWKSAEYTRAGARYIKVAGSPTLSEIFFTLKAAVYALVPGNKRAKISGIFAKTDAEQLEKLAHWIKEGTVKTVIDSTFPFEEAPAAFKKLKTGRARGKIVVKVGEV